MTVKNRLIEAAFPWQKVSKESAREKNNHYAADYGHIASLHTWMGRKPLAASRRAFLTKEANYSTRVTLQ